MHLSRKNEVRMCEKVLNNLGKESKDYHNIPIWRRWENRDLVYGMLVDMPPSPGRFFGISDKSCKMFLSEFYQIIVQLRT